MSGHLKPPSHETSVTVKELRERLGLFSFHHEERHNEPPVQNGSTPDLGLGPGVMIEWFVGRPGTGVLTSTLGILSRWLDGRGTWVIVDPAQESYVPALSGWGITPNRTLLIRPVTLQETCWVIEQCLRCPGVSVTLACIDRRLPMAVRRRWKMAAEVGGGVGVLFRT